MSTTTAPVSKPGRLLLWLGILCVILGLGLYVGQVSLKVLTTPWYMPIVGSLGTLLLIVALLQRLTIWRILALLIFGGLVAFEWYFLLVATRVPPYDGPVAAGQTLPAFTAKFSDGSTFDQDSVKGNQNTAMVFFRGRW